MRLHRIGAWGQGQGHQKASSGNVCQVLLSCTRCGVSTAMRLSSAVAAAAAAGAALPCLRVSCFGLQPAPPSLLLCKRTAPSNHRRFRAMKRALPCRSIHTELAAREKMSREAAPVMSSPLSRARDVLFEPAFRNTLPLMAFAGAVLGPNLDNYHSAFGVLTYKNPVEISIADHLLVTTDWW